MAHRNHFLTLDQQIVGDVYTSAEAMDNLVVLCDEFGSRFGGTEGERQAAEFFQAKMEEYGLTNVHLESVEYIGWTRGNARLAIVSPVHKEIPCITLPHSPSAELEAAVVDLGDGAPEDFERRADEVEGKIVMTTSVVRPKGSKRWVHRGEKYGRSVLAGAAGFLFVNHYPGYGPATGGIGHDGEGLIPGVSISSEDGAYILRLLKRGEGVTLRLTSTDRSQPMTSWNIVGDLLGESARDLAGVGKPEQMVMLGCHYDGHDISQGAGDPASGAVAVLEAARVLAKYAGALPCTVRFVLWGVEEIGLLGSRQYVKAHTGELSEIRFYLNMDSAGTQTNSRDIVLNEWPELEPLFVNWRDEMALEFKVAQSVHAFSDHFPFFMAGVPTGGIQSAEPPREGRGYGHTRYDTVDKVNLKGLREASALAARLALRIASEESWPAGRRDEQAVADLLDSPDYREEREFRDRLAAFYARTRGQ
jgi:Zn-dependent M28 family amino/carboxypeptidase